MANGMRRMRFAITTSAGGAATVTGSQTISGGKLFAVLLNIGTLAATTDITLSTSGADGSGTLLTLTDQSANAMYYPRKQAVDATGSVIAGVYDTVLIDGIPTITVAQGGGTKAGSVVIFYEE